MDDALLVRGLERVCDLSRVLERLGQRNRPARDPLRERLAVDQSQNECTDALALLDTEDGADVWMIQARQYAGLSLEASQPIGIGGKRRRQHLDRDVAPEPGVAGAIHFAHSADTDPFTHEIHAEPMADKATAVIVPHRMRDRRWRQALESFRRRRLIEQRLHLALQ